MLAFCAALTVLPTDAAASSKKPNALYDQAIDEDYLNTDFDAALKKLNKAVKLCKGGRCSKQVLAKVYVGLGTVHGGGKRDVERAYTVDHGYEKPGVGGVMDFGWHPGAFSSKQ